MLAGPGAWLLATPTERFWVFANGLVVSGDEAAWSYDSPFGA